MPMLKRFYRVLVFVMVVGNITGCGINNIPTYDEAVKASWSQVLNQYQRRADLVPNLVNTVKGYAAHEKETLQAVVEARSKVSQMTIPKDIITNPQAFKQFQESQDNLSGALGRLMLIVERYPDLKANQNFLSLQSQLEGTENRIAVSRRDYIEAVRVFNTEIRTIPGRWYRSIFYSDMQIKESFAVAESVKQAPQVNF